jgi:hypothetical protein
MDMAWLFILKLAWEKIMPKLQRSEKKMKKLRLKDLGHVLGGHKNGASTAGGKRRTTDVQELISRERPGSLVKVIGFISLSRGSNSGGAACKG